MVFVKGPGLYSDIGKRARGTLSFISLVSIYISICFVIFSCVWRWFRWSKWENNCLFCSSLLGSQIFFTRIIRVTRSLLSLRTLQMGWLVVFLFFFFILHRILSFFSIGCLYWKCLAVRGSMWESMVQI